MGDKEEKNKKIKQILIRILVIAILLGISLATYKVNLTDMLHNYVKGLFT